MTAEGAAGLGAPGGVDPEALDLRRDLAASLRALSPAAAAAYRELLDVLELHGGAPCRVGAEEWTGAEGAVGQALAVRVCRHCPAREACRRYAVEAQEPVGIWGGLSPSERRREARS